MKRLAVKKNEECMACLECVRACSQAFYKEFDEDLSSIRIVAKGASAKPMTCIQCGKCAKVCEAGAITQNPKTGVYMINKKLCTSCGKCVEICPMKVMVILFGVEMELLGINCCLTYDEYYSFYIENYGDFAAKNIQKSVYPHTEQT